MQKWEYLFVYFTSAGVKSSDGTPYQPDVPQHSVAEQKGKEGWELISAVSPWESYVTIIFKRPRVEK